MSQSGQVTLSQVEAALRELGGEATWDKILDQVTKNRQGDYSYYLNWLNYTKTAFQIIQQHCEGYKKFKGPTRFEKAGARRFRLIGYSSTPVASDIKEPSQPDRVMQETYRILRDTVLARRVKEASGYKCHICGQTLTLTDGRPYAEAHHVKPLARFIHEGMRRPLPRCFLGAEK